MPRRIPFLTAAVAVALLLPACGDDGGPRGASLVQGDGTYQQGSGDEASTGAIVIAKVGTELYAPIAAAA